MELSELGEFGLIERLSATLRQREGVCFGIGDDAAVLSSLSTPVVTCDALVEGVHFRRDWTEPVDLGFKAISVNVSDIAAMGGKPVAAFVTLSLGAEDSPEFIANLYEGMEAAAERYGLTIAGGDTVRSLRGLHLGVTVVGNAPFPILRSGARVGDVLLVTGTLGDSAAGLALLSRYGATASSWPADAASREFVLERHRRPLARLAEMSSALATRNEAIHAALDLSDGLAGDARHIADQSGLTVEIDVAALPGSDACRGVAEQLDADWRGWALSGGEDYELLLCVAQESAQSVASIIYDTTGTPVTVVGRCAKRGEDAVVLLDDSGRRSSAPKAYTHF